MQTFLNLTELLLSKVVAKSDTKFINNIKVTQGDTNMNI